MAYARIEGTDLYWEAHGAGEPVLLLHGGFGSIESWRPQIEALSPRYRVLAYERPGHGRSADVEGEFGYDRGVVEALAFLDAQVAGPAHVVGYSDGAIIGLLLALRHPERVRSLVAVSGNLDPTGFTGSAEAEGLPVLAPLPPDPAAETTPDVDREVHRRLSPDGPDHAEAVLAKLFRLWTREPSIDPGELAGIAARTLVVSGDRDTIRPDHSLLIASSIPAAQLCIVPGASHGLLAEKPAFVSALLLDFLGEDEDDAASEPASPSPVPSA